MQNKKDNNLSAMKIKHILLLLALLLPAGVIAQENYSLASPYQTILTHIKFLDEDNYQPAIAAKVFDPKIVSGEEAEDLAVKLLQIYKGEGINISFEDIPVNPNYTDSITGRQIYVIHKKYPQIYVEKAGKNWYYSNETVGSIEEIYKAVYPFGVDKLLDVLPKLGTSKYFGLYMWQLIGILIIIFVAVVVHKIFTLLIEKIIISVLIKKGRKAIARSFIAPVAKPASILIVFPLLLILIPVLQLPMKINYYTIIVLKSLWPVFATIVGYRLVDVLGVYLEKLATKTESTLDDQLVPLVRKAIKIFVIIIGGLAILANLEIDILPLLTGLSIGGLAFALAAQDTLKNFFGSIMIFVDKPFQIGDWITSGSIDGTVEEVGFRATRIRTFRNSVTYVPNAMLTDSTVDNHGLRRYRRFYTKISITYDTPTPVINAFVEGLRKIVENHPHTRKDNYHVYLNDMADSALLVMFYIFFEAPDWGKELQYRHEVLLEVIKLAENLGVQFAFPTQTLHMETFPGMVGNSPVYETDPAVLKKKLQNYLKQSKEWG